MAGRHPRGMRSRDERAHPVVKDAMAKGHLQTGAPYYVTGFATFEAANEGRKSINNAGRHLGVSVSSKASTDVEQLTDGTWRVRFRIFPKESGRQHVAQQSGGDPAKLAYNPYTRGEGPLVDEYGRSL